MAGDDSVFLPPEEATRRIHALTGTESQHLEAVARIYAAGTDWSAEDLLQEAFVAVLAERRRWRSDLATTVFLTGVLKSLASSHRKALERQPVVPANADADDTDRLESMAAEDETNPERQVAEDEAAQLFLNRLRAQFADDSDVLRVIEARIAGASTAALKTSLGMNQTQYESVCRRLLRGYDAVRKVKSS